METIYKIAYNIENKIQHYFVFIGTRFGDNTPEEIREIFMANPTDDRFPQVFDAKELEHIQKNNIKVYFSKYDILVDDTIETIKNKLLLTIRNMENIAYDEIYLFYQTKTRIDATEVYQMLTKNGTLPLTKERLIQFLLNVENIDIAALDVKDEYEYDDILSLQLEKEERVIYKPLGQSIYNVENDFPYVVNPFNVTEYSEFLEKYGEELVTTTNKSILVSSGKIHKNTIFVCAASDVLSYAETNGLSSTVTAKIYYPFLFRQNITSTAEVADNKYKLIEKTDAMLSTKVQKNIERMQLFYDIYQHKTSELPYTETGIKSISLEVHPRHTLQIPLDIIFKILHATLETPLIKYNPGKRQEKIYRLYTNQISTNGKKIPYLMKPAIIKITKSMSSERGVHVYIEHVTQNTEGNPVKNIVLCSFYKNAVIHIESSFHTTMTIKEVNALLLAATKTVLNTVTEYFEQSGYQIAEFRGIDESNINIRNMEYAAHIPIKKKLNFGKINQCLANIFSIINDNIHDGIVMRLKRVSNYNEMDSQEAFIIEKLNMGSRETEIIKGLMDNFGLTEVSSRNKLADFITSMQVVQDAFQKKKFKVKANPGFLTTITKEQFSNKAMIVVSGITDVAYLNTIPIYIDTMLRLSEFPTSTTVAQSKIAMLCEKKDVTTSDIVADDVDSDEDKDKLEDDKDEGVDSDSDLDEGEIVAPLEIVGDDSLKDMMQDLGADTSEVLPEKQPSPTAPNMLDMLMASDDETSEDDDDDDDDDYEGGGNTRYDTDGGGDGSESDEEFTADITGMSINNPNPFFKRMQDREPVLFLKESEGKFNAYSRACPWNVRRQPVMLTDKEKEKIDKDHPGSYHKAIKYGSTPEKQFWYICPRYWSLKNNTSLTEEEAKSGKYGTIIPAGAKKVPPGGGVIEFTSKIHKDKDGNYIQHYPGFLKPESHPDGKCLPCCFKSWDAPAQVKRRKICAKESSSSKPNLARQKSDIAENYIMGSDKFPLEDNRYGYLPLSVQQFLNTDNTQCQINAMNTNLKRNHPCMLRHGVETSKTQSFIGCIADIWVDKTKSARLSITEMKAVFIAAMSIDVFITLQNGDLIDIFTPQEKQMPEQKRPAKQYSSTYTSSKLYKTIDFTKTSQEKLFRRIVSAYENFINYLRDDEIKINYTYLWDLICKPNPKLFESGLNLIILEIPEDDITDNINIICPTNHYSNELFHVKRETVIIIKKQNYYEPVYLFEDKGSEFSVMRKFNMQIASRIPNVIKTLNLIKYSVNNKCGPKNSMPKTYRFKQNIVLDKLLELLLKHEYIIIKQIMNLSGRVIGVVTKHTQDEMVGIIPCYPSSAALDYDFTFDGLPYVLSYSDTKRFLQKAYDNTKGNIPCLPAIKILEDQLIVGILTETNQFVSVEPTADRYEDDLPKVEDTNYNDIDKTAMTDHTIDTERENFIKTIELESNFYSVFRNTVRLLLGKYENINIRKELEKLSQDTTISYQKRLTSSVKLLKTITEKSVDFVEYKPEVLQDIKEITSCNTKCDEKPHCFSEGDDKCVLLIPTINLIHGGDNEEQYHGRLADEIIRYTRIKSFIFKPQVFLSFKNIGYNLRDDELILLQSLLLEEYFDDIVLQSKNPYVVYNTYDTASPLITQSYSNVDDLNNYIDQYKKHRKPAPSLEELRCLPPKKSVISGKWRAAFPENSMELVFSDSPMNCTFDIILILIKYNDKRYQKITIPNLLEILALEYAELDKEYHNQIMLIWKSQGKTGMVKRIQKKETTIEHIVMGNNYYATNIDIWILATRFNVPLVIYSSTKLIENKDTFLVAHSDGSDAFYFIRAPGVRINHVPKYRLVVSGASAKIPITSLSTPIKNEIRRKISDNLLKNFISSFDAEKAKMPAPKKLVLKKKI